MNEYVGFILFVGLLVLPFLFDPAEYLARWFTQPSPSCPCVKCLAARAKTLEVTDIELCMRPAHLVEGYIRQRLKDAGFDFTRPIFQAPRVSDCVTLFQQPNR